MCVTGLTVGKTFSRNRGTRHCQSITGNCNQKLSKVHAKRQKYSMPSAQNTNNWGTSTSTAHIQLSTWMVTSGAGQLQKLQPTHKESILFTECSLCKLNNAGTRKVDWTTMSLKKYVKPGDSESKEYSQQPYHNQQLHNHIVCSAFLRWHYCLCSLRYVHLLFTNIYTYPVQTS